MNADIWDVIGGVGFVLLFVGIGLTFGFAGAALGFGAVFVGAYVLREIQLFRAGG